MDVMQMQEQTGTDYTVEELMEVLGEMNITILHQEEGLHLAVENR